jgi:predicted DNA binding CopG/RHH family protein
MKVTNKDETLVIRLEKPLKKALKEEAAAKGLRISEYVRRLILGEISRKKT